MYILIITSILYENKFLDKIKLNSVQDHIIATPVPIPSGSGETKRLFNSFFKIENKYILKINNLILKPIKLLTNSPALYNMSVAGIPLAQQSIAKLCCGD